MDMIEQTLAVGRKQLAQEEQKALLPD